MESIRLYRGDSSKVDEFNVRKTYKTGLLGQGIYLTDTPTVAETYREKGLRGSSYSFMTVISAKIKPEAIAGAFKVYCTHNKQRKMKELDLEKEFKYKLENEIITLTREGIYQGKGTDWHFRFTEKTYNGFISVFEFPEPFFSRNCVNMDARFPDKGLLEILKNPELWNTDLAYTEFQRSHSLMYILCRIKFPKLIPILQEYGIHGFEYAGGKRLGGPVHHRAFSVWDEDFVNAHLIKQYK